MTSASGMEQVRIRSFDAGVYPTTLPSPRMPGAADHSPREPSGFRKSLNPIYTVDTDHSTTAVVSSSDVVANADLGGSRCSHDGAARTDGGVDDDPSGAAVLVRRHTGGDGRWDAIRAASARESLLSLGHFRLLRRLGYGDIGSVYLVELRGAGGALFAMKVMDKGSLVSRNKLARAQTEREILGLLDHPFLPTLYSHFETDKFFCLVMEYCSGGNLHSLRQKQPDKHFTEHAARFYASEVLLALEYLHMLGVVYRDLKPENVLVREEGHIMLSDFDLSLRCSVSPTLVRSPSGRVGRGGGLVHGCMLPRILPTKKGKKKAANGGQHELTIGNGKKPPSTALEFTAEPTGARSMSFVGTHEYLAPEIIRGEGHGSAVDWSLVDIRRVSVRASARHHAFQGLREPRHAVQRRRPAAAVPGRAGGQRRREGPHPRPAGQGATEAARVPARRGGGQAAPVLRRRELGAGEERCAALHPRRCGLLLAARRRRRQERHGARRHTEERRREGQLASC